MVPEAIAFDLNNCLVKRADTPMLIKSTIYSVLHNNHQSFVIPSRYFDRGWLIEFGENREWLFNYLLYQGGIPPYERRELTEECLRAYSLKTRKPEMVKAYNDTSVLEKFEQPLFLISNSSAETVKSILEETDMDRHFKTIFADGKKEEGLEKIKSWFGKDVVLVGDSSEDVCIGRKHGFYTVAVNRRLVPITRIMRAKPHLIVKDLKVLYNHIR